MNLSNLLSTLDSQIPIAAVDVLSPDEATIIQWLTTEANNKLSSPVFFWNLGVSTLEQCLIAADGGLVFKPVAEYKRPQHADPLLFVFDYIANFSGNGVFILGDIHPFIAKNSPQLSWEILSKVKNLYHRLKPTDKRIVLLGQNIQLHESLVRLIPYCEVPLPSIDQILEHINSYLHDLQQSAIEQELTFTVTLENAEFETLSRAALGLTLEEISDFLRLTVKENLTNDGVVVDADFIPKAVEYKTRLLSQMGIELGKPAIIPFGGLDLLREWLTRRRRLFTQEARSLSLPQPKGVLLAGPPGTGKSNCAKNIATILNLPLLQLDIASLLGSLVGESEGNVRRALKTAQAIAPCVLWIDEIEKALSGSGDTSGVSQRILGNILTFMSESTSGVFVVATCNDPSALPSELKRKGRFDENFFVDLPTEPERVQILAIHLQRFGIHLESEYLEAIAASTAKFSGAELETLASEAALLAFDEGRPQQVTLADLKICRQTITPLAIQDAAAVERMQGWASTARRASSPVVAAKTQSLRAAKFRNMN
ncbi:AAA family ATPase [Nostoc sp. 'Peltigera membranacea cyanobiont' N6]|uniref:AAA family ATPase n=1 Tax=Nostoc sp. 'Peltigera membranacea cyanobiont' N6 TaxID=1261031 RepID=UPI000CF3410E|nr:AAA family ATPase [Nostoc sp. 'Peltigera membranacea cyanobiont' N6]AVH68170.1 AAA ATPase SpoVK [Nostoc sp. 'Peltigera membranacea cyanobiont' N6]